MIKIPLPHTDITEPRRYVLVDDIDHDLAAVGWSLLVYNSGANTRVRRSSKGRPPKTENYLNREVWLREHGEFGEVRYIKHANGNALDCRRVNLVGVNQDGQDEQAKKTTRIVRPAKLPRSTKLTELHTCPNIAGLLSGISYRVCALRAEWAPGIWRVRFPVCESCPIGVAASRRWPQYEREPEIALEP